MKGHGNKKGMSLSKLAILSGKSEYHGKACACGNTARRVDNGCCTVCCGKPKEVKVKLRSKKVDVFALANAAFRR